MSALLTYIFWPNPGIPVDGYGNIKIQALLGVCATLVVASVFIRMWRRRQQNPVTKRLSRSWSAASLWFGLSGALLVVSRVEMISFLAMRFLWVIWAAAFALYAAFQIRSYRARHYEVLPQERAEDPREKYLPGRRK